MGKRAGVVSVDVEPNLSRVGPRIESLASTLRPLGLNIDLDDRFVGEVEAGVARSRRSLDSIDTTKAQGELDDLGAAAERQAGRIGVLSNLSAQSLVTVGAGATFAGTRIIGSLKPATDAASDLNETVAFSEQVFGGSAEAISKWADSSVEKLAQSRREAIGGATDFAVFGKAAGLAGDDLVGFSTDLVQLAADFASAKNTTPQDAITAISAALRGETEPIRQYGVLLDDATLRQEALALGIVKTTKEALTPQQRVLAAQSAIFKQSRDIQGDLARTYDSTANSAKRLAAAQKDAQAERGQGLLGLLTAANEAGAAVLDTLDKIPGATTALGVGTFGVGAAAVIGGSISSIAGGVKAVGELRQKFKDTTEAAADTAETIASVADAASQVQDTGASTAGATARATATRAATAATEAEATVLKDVAGSAAAAGTAGTAAMTSIAASAAAAVAPVVAVGTALDVVSVGRLTETASGIGQIGSAIGELPTRAGVIDVEVLYDSFDELAAIGPAAASSVSGVGSSVAGLAVESERVAGPLARGASRARDFVGSITPLQAGTAAATVGVIGLSIGLQKANEQTEKGIALLTELSTLKAVQAAFDPSQPERFSATVDDIAEKLAKLQFVEPQNWMDKIGAATGTYDLRLFGDSQLSGNQARVFEETITNLQAAIDGLNPDAARKFLDAIVAQLDKLPADTTEARAAVQELYGQIEQNEAAKRGADGIGVLDEAVSRLGITVDREKGKFEQYADVLAGIAAPGLDAVRAGESARDATKAVADAQKKLDDIVNGNTEGLKSAIRALSDAREELGKAVARTGPGSKAARDAAGDVRDALRAYRDLQIEAGKADQGDFFDPRTQDLQDAYDRIIEANEKLAQIQSGNSDEVVAARDRLRDAQARYNEELAKTGPASDEAQQALADLEDARQRQFESALQLEEAEARFQQQLEDHPEAVQATIEKIDDLVSKGIINVDVAEQYKRKLLEAAAAAKQVTDNLPSGEPATPTSTTTSSSGRSDPYVPRTWGPLQPKNAEQIGLPPVSRGAGDSGPLRPGTVRTDFSDRPWKWDGKLWIPQFASGGMVPGSGFGDTVTANLTPGEYVMRRSAVEQIGAPTLAALNQGTPLPDVAGQDAVVAELQALRRELARGAAAAGGSSTTDALLIEQNQLLRSILAGQARTGADVRRGAVAFT